MRVCLVPLNFGGKRARSPTRDTLPDDEGCCDDSSIECRRFHSTPAHPINRRPAQPASRPGAKPANSTEGKTATGPDSRRQTALAIFSSVKRTAGLADSRQRPPASISSWGPWTCRTPLGRMPALCYTVCCELSQWTSSFVLLEPIRVVTVIVPISVCRRDLCLVRNNIEDDAHRASAHPI